MILQNEIKRIDYIDRLKGVLILWVTWYHTTHPSWTNPYCHVPLFLILSGVFLRTDIDFKSFFSKKVKRLFIPFAFFYFFGFSYNLLLSIWQGNVESFLSPRLLYAWLLPEPLPFNIPIWFIITLFYISILAYPVMKWIKSPWIGFGIPMILSYIFNVYCSSTTLPIHGNHAIIWFPFVIFGYYFGKKIMKWVEQKKRSILGGAICLALSLLIGCYKTSDVPVVILIFYLQIFLFLGIAIPLFRHGFMGNWAKFLSYLGKNSLILLGIQSLFLNFMIQWVRPALNLPDNVWVGFAEMVCTVLLSLPAIYLFNRFTPELVGKDRERK